MEKKRRKRGENSYLNDFHPNLAGEYIYDGALYACTADADARKALKRRLWICAALLLIAAVVSGSIPAPGMLNCFYVILPFILELIAAVTVAWAAVRLGRDWDAVREYVYERSVTVLPGRAMAAAVCAAAGFLCEIIYLAVSGHDGQPLYAALYLLLKALSLLCALTIRRLVRRSDWAKVTKSEQ